MAKILVVDDDEGMLELATRALTLKGHTVLTKSSPFSVSATMVAEKPHLVLLDVYMPGFSGTDLVRLIRDNEQLKYTRVLLWSAADNVEKDAEECGADGYITKPVSLADLVDIVESYL